LSSDPELPSDLELEKRQTRRPHQRAARLLSGGTDLERYGLT